MALGIAIVRFVIRRPIIFGMISRTMMVNADSPMTRAASTKSCSFKRYTSPLVKRQVPVHPTITIAMIKLLTPEPNTTITKIQTIRDGIP